MTNSLRYLMLACALPLAINAALAEDGFKDGRGFFVLGRSFQNPTALNDALAPRGLGSFKHATLIGGQGLGRSHGRFLFGAEGYAVLLSATADASNPSTRTSLNGGMGLLDFGYVLNDDAFLRIYPVLGVGFGGLGLHIRNVTPASFSQALDQPARDTMVGRHFGVLNLSLNLDFLFNTSRKENETGGPAIGVKAGYLLTFGRSGWKADELTLPGGPEVAFDGAYLAVMFGGGGRKPRVAGCDD